MAAARCPPATIPSKPDRSVDASAFRGNQPHSPLVPFSSTVNASLRVIAERGSLDNGSPVRLSGVQYRLDREPTIESCFTRLTRPTQVATPANVERSSWWFRGDWFAATKHVDAVIDFRHRFVEIILGDDCSQHIMTRSGRGVQASCSRAIVSFDVDNE